MNYSVNKTFNFYCDESSHLENDGKPYMLISYVSSAYNEVKTHTTFIRLLKQKHGFRGEIKWSGVSTSQYQFYADLIDYFFSTKLNFRAVIVNKSQIKSYGDTFSYNDFYYKMYYQLIHHKVSMEHSYNVYLDTKDTCGSKRIVKLKEILNYKYGTIRNLQIIDSKESLLMQVTDLIMGAINYYLRGDNAVVAKLKLIDKIMLHSKTPLTQSTPRGSDKFNLFFIDLN